ncbi:hypothetical protein CW304_04735 [Bacillus sp. UFRGS-B20]|nr:hypothetical protein CW304_04735 [Bacillus sp. UFRGS-B20]
MLCSFSQCTLVEYASSRLNNHMRSKRKQLTFHFLSGMVAKISISLPYFLWYINKAHFKMGFLKILCSG